MACDITVKTIVYGSGASRLVGVPAVVGMIQGLAYFVRAGIVGPITALDFRSMIGVNVETFSPCGADREGVGRLRSELGTDPSRPMLMVMLARAVRSRRLLPRPCGRSSKIPRFVVPLGQHSWEKVKEEVDEALVSG